MPSSVRSSRMTFLHGISIAFFLVIFVWDGDANPMQDSYICGRPTCVAGPKFKYMRDTKYEYSYSVDIRTLFGGTSRNESTLHFDALLSLEFLSECEGILRVDKNMTVTERAVLNGITQRDVPKMNAFGNATGEFPLRFAFNDGIISEVCPEQGEASWVLNFKKGILSSIQNSMKRFDVGQQVYETDVNGNCRTHYSLDRAEETSLIITKNKDFSTCSNRYKYQSILQTTPYVFRSNYQAMPIMKSRNSCNISIDHNVYNRIECEETHVFQPFSSGDSGAKTITRQTFVLLYESNVTAAPLEIVTRRQPLLFDHDLTPKPTSGELRTSRDLIKLMCRLNVDDVQPEFPDAFTKFIHTARLLSYPALNQVYIRSTSMCITGRKHVLDALPLLGSNAAVAVMTDVILSQGVERSRIHEWLFTLAFMPRPDNQTISIITPLLETEHADAQYVLSISSVVRTYCKWNSNCKEEPEINHIIFYLENQLRQGCQHRDKNRTPQEKILIALKSLANIGVPTPTLTSNLMLCIEDEDLPTEMKIAAIETHRRLPCEESRSYFLELYRNHEADAELRIAAYLQVMKCANYIVIRTIKHSLQEEEVNQVGSFVWSHLHNLLKSSIPSRVEIQGLLQDRDLGQKFSSDVRKFSHNFEGSVFFDEYNVGGNYESNVIFSPKSYIPRSAMLNVTVDLFGDSINVFEVAGRIEGFEHYIEAMFGPKGPLSSHNVNEKLRHLRLARSAPNNLKSRVDELPNVVDNNFSEPKASFALKVFGNELKHYSFLGRNEIDEALSSINPVAKLQQLLSGKEISYNKATVFMDSNYIVPTGTGFPINLNAVGTAAVNLKLSGSLKFDDVAAELDVKGNIRPSVSVDVVGSLGVDAYYASTGIKLKTNMYTSSAVDSQLKVRGKRLVSLSFNLPKDKTEIITAQSELVVMHGGEEELQDGIRDGRIEKRMCSWPSLDQTLGLNFCADLQVPNATHRADAPKFLLNGPTKFGISFQKADPSAKKYLLEYKWETGENATFVSFVFDTPGSNMKREMSAKLNLDTNSQNLTLLIQSATSKYEALGKYKNTPEEMYINFGLKINGTKHVDAELSLRTEKELNGLRYKPRLYLAINNTRIAELSGSLRWVKKVGVSQSDINLKFQTRKLDAQLGGFVKRSDASIFTNLKLEYQFQNASVETVKLQGKLSNRTSISLTKIEGTLQLQSSAYPQFNFISSLMFMSTQDHLECKIEISYGPNIKDENNKLTLLMSFTHAKTYDSSKVTVLLEITKPISNIDMKFTVNYHSSGPDIVIRTTIRYAKGKDIFITLNLKLPRSSFTFIEVKLNMTLPSFHPMVIELQLHEKTPHEYNIDLSAMWFSGHNLTAKGLYQDRSTSKASSHNLKLLIKSPSFHEIALSFKYLRDDKEFKIDIQVDYNKDKYVLILKHESPSSVEFETYVEIRVKSSVYTLTALVNLLLHRQVVIELHLDQIRDIHLTLRSMNEPDHKEAGIEIKWDANRDPGQKFAASIMYYHPDYMNYSGNFMVSYPGRTIKGNYLLAVKGTLYDSYARLEWSPVDAIHVKLGAVYKYEDSMVLSLKSELVTPFETWKKTSIAAGLRHEGNLFQANGSVHWQDDQNVALNIFGDYFVSNKDFSCEFNASIISTIPQISSMSGSVFHRECDKKYETNIHVQYHPERVVTVKSTWQLEESSESINLTGKISLTSPYHGYRDGMLICRLHLSSDWDVKGAADLTIERRKYTFSIDGYVTRITENMIVFNLTTPLEHYSIITGRFGYSQESKHLVAEVKSPTGAIGVEILFTFYSTNEFDIKFNFATPIEFLQKALVIAKLNDEMVDFRCGWNNLVIGFSGLWHYINSTDFEYRYRLYTPMDGFHENGVVAKLIKTDGLDFELGLNLGESKLGIKTQGAEKPRVPVDLKLASKKMDEIRENSDYETEDDSDIISWKGLIEFDTLLYPTFKGMLEIDTKGSVYIVVASLTLPNGTAELYDEFDFEDYFTVSNRLHITTPSEKFKELKSNFNYKLDIGFEYGTSIDVKILSGNEWIKSGMSVKYSSQEEEDEIQIHTVSLNIFTPFEGLVLFNVKGALETEDNIYRTNLTLATNESRTSLIGYLDVEPENLEASIGLAMQSPSYTIPSFRISGKRDVTQPESKYEFMLEKLEPVLQVFKIESLWQYIEGTHLKSRLKIQSPYEDLSSAEASVLISKMQGDQSFVCNIIMSTSPEHTFNMNSRIKDNDINIELETPLASFRKGVFTGTFGRTDSGATTLKGTLNSGAMSYTVNAEFQFSREMPLSLQTTLLSSTGEDDIALRVLVSANDHGYGLQSSVHQGQDKLDIQGNISIKRVYNSSFNLKISSTHDIYKLLIFNGKLHEQSNGSITAEINTDTNFKGFEKIRLAGNILLRKELGNIILHFDFNNVKGNYNSQWTWLLMEDMYIIVNGYYIGEDTSKYGSVKLFYKNIKKSLEDISLGIDINLDRNIWQFGANTTLKMENYQNMDILINLKLPPPHHDVHSFHGKLHYTDKYEYLIYILKYSTSRSKKSYGVFTEMNINKEEIDGILSLEYGTGEIKHINNTLSMKRDDTAVDIIYILHTPCYEEETFKAKLLYNKLAISNIRADLFFPASQNIAQADVELSDLCNMNGTIQSNTPFTALPYAGINFKTATNSKVHQRFVEVFWPNNTAVFNSEYVYDKLQHNTNLTGVILVEIPLATRHTTQIDYGYEQVPLQKTGHAAILYNKQEFLEAKYNCDSVSSAGFDKDVINIEIENNYFPLGIKYDHEFTYNGGMDGANYPTIDYKRAEIFKLRNQTFFNLTGKLNIRSTLTGQEILMTAIHSSRVVKLKTDYNFSDHQFNQTSTLFLDPNSWVSYDIAIENKTNNEKEEEHIEINFAYPRRNFTVNGYYQIANNSMLSQMNFEWDKQEQKKSVGASLDWKRLSTTPNKQRAVFCIKHPSFMRDVTLNGLYYSDDKDLLNVSTDLVYSNESERKLSLSGKLWDNSQRGRRDYSFEILGSHPKTRLDLMARGDIKLDGTVYQTNNVARYGRSYRAIETGELKGRVNTALKEIDLEKRSRNEISYIKGKYVARYPVYKLNGTVKRGNELNSKGDYYLNLHDKLLKVSVNTTKDDSLGSFYMDGSIPDSRNALFNVWTDYGDLILTDITFYIRLNHSRLMTSNLRWRPELENEIRSCIDQFGNDIWNGFFDTVDFWKKYIRSETQDAIEGIWIDSNEFIQGFLADVEELKLLRNDFEDFKVYLNTSYNNNEFYIRDIVSFSSNLIDELSLRGHIESLPDIVNEIWEIMGESGEAIRNSLLWMIETLKSSYRKAVEFINSLMKGDLISKISTILEGLVKKYDKFIKDLHVTFVKYMEGLWHKASKWLSEHWDIFVRAIEPGFVTFAHYVETIVWNVSNEVLDFLYQRRNEIVESPYFSKFANFTQDLDRLYKDMTKNDILTNIGKYSKIIYEFLRNKYFTMVPFGKELQDIVTEIINEIKVVQKFPSINYAIQKYNELYDKIIWLYDYLDLGTKIQEAITLIHLKITDITQTALQAENRYREAKTKFIFDPENGHVTLEQKFPMSWYAFNETPRFEEIPEYKALCDLQNYFVSSNTTFWTLYYEYKPYTEPSNWLPPFKGEAMIAGPQHFMTFDRTFFEFQGSCSYLLAQDFVDGNFSIVLSYDKSKKGLYEISFIIEKGIVEIDIFEDTVKLEVEGIKKLPIEIGDTFIYQEADMVTVESAKGFLVQCNLKFDVCVFSLSGWYFGKTAGLLGTMDNEPTSDFLTSQKEIETDIGRFAQSWALEPNTCKSSKNYALQVKEPDADLREKCESFFKSKGSQFSSCFARVDSTPFLIMCLNSRDSGEKEPCTIAVAYMQACLVENAPLRIPDSCVKCQLVNGTELPEGDFRELNGHAVPHSTDIVFLVEAEHCNENIRAKKNIDFLISTLTKELTEAQFASNRFAVVAFGGSGVYNQPRSIVVNNNVFATPQLIPQYFEDIPVGNGTKDIFGAIRYAAKLLFRPGVSKTFILLPCSNCDAVSMTLDYSVLHQVLLESDIKLHILMNDEFGFDKPRIQKIFYGMDGVTAYTKKDVKSMKGDIDLRRQVKLPKSRLGFCTALALETNGTVFTAKRLESEKKSAVKKFLTVFGKRIARTASPYPCQTCECTADNNGMSYMECFPCEYPQPAHYNYDFNDDEMYILPNSQEDIDYNDEEDTD